ncbi:translation initiation factor IF-2 [Candidatus Woesearchaeota archaeon]|nr:translation initiation factor IF-2 [Candidatus Woesearchaeota archaeon]
METRSVICTVMGHVDHGKSSILDRIRGTAIVESEPGKITQAIGASIVTLDVIRKIAGSLLETLKIELTIPGLLFIDTPGHAAFTNLRKRGGNLADIAILVIDIQEGMMPQTLESLEILKTYKTPFIIALNKIDLLQGWQETQGTMIQKIMAQSPNMQALLDQKLYELVGKLSENGFNAERFDRVEDFTKQVAIVPVSAKTGEGIAELLVMLAGLAQKYLEQSLKVNLQGPAKGTVLEVKEETGLGTTLDVILFDGSLTINDTIVIGTTKEPLVTKVKALLEPMPLAEMRDKKAKYSRVQEVKAATGVKISAPDLKEVVAGMPLRGVKNGDLEKVKQDIMQEVQEVLIETDENGIIIKADSLGSLEALIKLLRERSISIRSASVGTISRKDIVDAETNYEKDPLTAVILGFNILPPDSASPKVRIITSNIIYRLVEEYEAWKQAEARKQQENILDTMNRPFKLEILKGCIFRQSNPAIVGVDVLAGVVRTNMPVMDKNGNELARIKEMQLNQENVPRAEKGQQVAVSLPNVTAGRQIAEGDILFSSVPEEHFRKMKELKQNITPEEIEILKEIAEIMRRQNPLWGV